MTVVLDTSALLALGIDGPLRATTLAALDGDPIWAASAMALTEALPAIDRLTDEPILRLDLEDADPPRVGPPPRRARSINDASIGPPRSLAPSRSGSATRSTSPPPNDSPARFGSSRSIRPTSVSPSDSASTSSVPEWSVPEPRAKPLERRDRSGVVP